MATFYIHIRIDNDTFQPDHSAEVSRLLRQVAHKVEAGKRSGNIQDSNGNTVGSFQVGPDQMNSRINQG